MYTDSQELNYRQRRQEAVNEAREMAARASAPIHKGQSFTKSAEAVSSSLQNFIKHIELDDIVLIGLFFIILDEGLEENFLILALIAVLFFFD